MAMGISKIVRMGVPARMVMGVGLFFLHFFLQKLGLLSLKEMRMERVEGRRIESNREGGQPVRHVMRGGWQAVIIMQVAREVRCKVSKGGPSGGTAIPWQPIGIEPIIAKTRVR